MNTHPLTECDMHKCSYERQAYEALAATQIAAISRRCGLIDVMAERRAIPAPLLTEAARELRAEMACTAGGPASVPVRRVRKPLPTLPWWKRWEMQWQRVCAGVNMA